MSSESLGKTSQIRVLVVLAHPDDPEFFCGGTVARWITEGRRVTYCLLTRGDKGSDVVIDTHELAQLREKEQRAAAAELGVEEVLFLDFPDGYLTPNIELRRDIVRVIRQVKPDVVVTCDPTNLFPSSRYFNHADHRAAGLATLDAIYPAARSALYFPELLHEEGLEPHRVNEVYVAGTQNPDLNVDITDYFDQKIAALRHHHSQLSQRDDLEEGLRERMRDPASPPDSQRYIERFKRIQLG